MEKKLYLIMLYGFKELTKTLIKQLSLEITILITNDLQLCGMKFLYQI